MYELCTLERPFEGEHIVRVIGNILNASPKRIPKLYSPELQMIIDMLLQKDPIQRATIKEILSREDIKKYRNLIDVVRNVNPGSLKSQFEIKLNPTFKEPEASDLHNETAHFQGESNEILNQSMNKTEDQEYQRQHLNLEELKFNEQQIQENQINKQEENPTATEIISKIAAQSKKPYQREIQIDVASIDKNSSQKEISAEQRQSFCTQNVNQNPSTPTQINTQKTHLKKKKNSSMTDKELILKNDLPTKNVGTQGQSFTFSESLLKKAPRSPNRPMLMQDYVKSKIGEQKFNKIVQMINESNMDSLQYFKEKPEEIIKIVGQENLSIIDVGIDFGAFNFEFQQKASPKLQAQKGQQKKCLKQQQTQFQPLNKIKQNVNNLKCKKSQK